MALIDPKDAENIYNESGWAARRKEAREWRDAFTAREILEAVDELPDDLGEEQPKYPIGVSLIQVFAETHRDVLFGIPPSVRRGQRLPQYRTGALAHPCGRY